MTKLRVLLRFFQQGALLYLPLFLDANSAKRKAFKDLAIKMKNLLSNGQAKKENPRSKLDKKPLNRNGNIGGKNGIQ